MINAESCEETTLNQAFTRTALANNSCAIIPGLDHVSLECTGTNGTATGASWVAAALPSQHRTNQHPYK